MTHGGAHDVEALCRFPCDSFALRDGGARHIDLNAGHGGESFGGPIVWPRHGSLSPYVRNPARLRYSITSSARESTLFGIVKFHRLCRFQVDDKEVARWDLDRQIGWLCALEN